MNKLVQKDLQFFLAQQGGADRFLRFGRKHTDFIKIHLSFKTGGYICILAPDQAERLIFKEEYCEWVSDSDAIRKKQGLADAGSRESGLSDKSGVSSAAGDLTARLSDWHVCHFHDTGDTSKVRQFCTIHDNEYLRPQGENLAAFLFSIKDTPEYQGIVQTIKRVFPFFQDFILKPDKTDPNRIRLRWKHRGTDDYFDANAFSDGSLRFICLATLLLQPVLPTMILLDEPELGLHPYAAELLAGMMRSAAHKTQIIASTQSVTLANQFEWQDVIIVEQPDNESRFLRLEEKHIESWMHDYRIGDIWEKNLIGGTPLC
ncbi:AAA family ATPase [Desulfococcaceae bacterium HSG8]|nr:AAA family ATPase [Desulfococcaceae bacterium HSG8]